MTYLVVIKHFTIKRFSFYFSWRSRSFKINGISNRRSWQKSLCDWPKLELPILFQKIVDNDLNWNWKTVYEVPELDPQILKQKHITRTEIIIIMLRSKLFTNNINSEYKIYKEDYVWITKTCSASSFSKNIGQWLKLELHILKQKYHERTEIRLTSLDSKPFTNNLNLECQILKKLYVKYGFTDSNTKPFMNDANSE